MKKFLCGLISLLVCCMLISGCTEEKDNYIYVPAEAEGESFDPAQVQTTQAPVLTTVQLWTAADEEDDTEPPNQQRADGKEDALANRGTLDLALTGWDADGIHVKGSLSDLHDEILTLLQTYLEDETIADVPVGELTLDYDGRVTQLDFDITLGLAYLDAQNEDGYGPRPYPIPLPNAELITINNQCRLTFVYGDNYTEIHLLTRYEQIDYWAEAGFFLVEQVRDEDGKLTGRNGFLCALACTYPVYQSQIDEAEDPHTVTESFLRYVELGECHYTYEKSEDNGYCRNDDYQWIPRWALSHEVISTENAAGDLVSQELYIYDLYRENEDIILYDENGEPIPAEYEPDSPVMDGANPVYIRGWRETLTPVLVDAFRLTHSYASDRRTGTVFAYGEPPKERASGTMEWEAELSAAYAYDQGLLTTVEISELDEDAEAVLVARLVLTWETRTVPLCLAHPQPLLLVDGLLENLTGPAFSIYSSFGYFPK